MRGALLTMKNICQWVINNNPGQHMIFLAEIIEFIRGVVKTLSNVCHGFFCENKLLLLKISVIIFNRVLMLSCHTKYYYVTLLGTRFFYKQQFFLYSASVLLNFIDEFSLKCCLSAAYYLQISPYRDTLHFVYVYVYV